MTVHCKLVNLSSSHANILRDPLVAYLIVLNTRDTERLNSLFDLLPSKRDQRSPSRKTYPNPNSNRTNRFNANCEQLGVKKKKRLDDLLHLFVTGGPFSLSSDPKRVPFVC